MLDAEVPHTEFELDADILRPCIIANALSDPLGVIGCGGEGGAGEQAGQGE